MVLHFAAMTIGARIKQARERIGMSQTRLAELLGVTRSACSQWESAGGTSPKRDRLEEIARLLGVNYEWLATGGGPIQRGERWSVRVTQRSGSPCQPTSSNFWKSTIAWAPSADTRWSLFCARCSSGPHSVRPRPDGPQKADFGAAKDQAAAWRTARCWRILRRVPKLRSTHHQLTRNR